MPDALMNRRHRWPAGDTPLTGVHGGSAEAAKLAIQEAAGARPANVRRLPARVTERQRAVAIAETQLAQLLSKLPPVPVRVLPEAPDPKRKDRVRPRLNAAAKASRSKWLIRHREAQADLCAYCRGPMIRDPIKSESWRRPTLDHVVPLSKGGDDSLENTVAACAGCNSAKADLSAAYFRANIRALRRKRGFP